MMETHKPIVLPVRLQPANLRPIAYRILSKKHGLNIQTDSLKILADYIGLTYGSNWKSSKAQQFLDDLGCLWKEQGRNIFLDPKGIDSVIKELNAVNEPPSNNYHPLKKLELNDIVKTVNDNYEIEIYNDDKMDTEVAVNKEGDHKLHWHEFFKVILPKNQPNYRFNPIQKQYEKETASLETFHIASTNSKLSIYKIRYAIIEQRLSRNSNFQQPTFSSLNSLTGSITSTAVSITSIKNLLGRHGQRFVLFGLLTNNESGNYSLEDESDKIELELSQCIATDGSYYCPGFFVMVEGIYSNSGKFYCSTMGHPPLERREVTLEAYGFIDFLGIHSSTNKTNRNFVSSINGVTRIDRALKKNLQLLEKELHNHKMIILGYDCNLDDLKKVTALKKLFNRLTLDLETDHDIPICLIFNGSFSDKPFISSQYNSATVSATSSSTHYKQSFDSLALILENYPLLCSKVSMIFVPGDNDPWSSIYNMGSSVMWPQNPIPKIFTNRLNRLVKDCHFVSNPSKLNYLNQEIVFLRDDMNSRLKRNSLQFTTTTNKEDDVTDLNIDSVVRDTPVPTKILEARKLVKTVLDQGHLSPFLSNKRPIIWDKDYYLTLSPLPSVVILNDSTINEFDVTYEGCHVINPGPMMTRNQLNYVEYWPSTMKAVFKQV